jgi:O-antigen/teichoic acid export membrane protein
MSRLKRFVHSLVSGYVLLGANILYTLASVPLALHYLSTPEFGLWALVSQLGCYISLIDLGMNTSVARILIDHKDDRQTGAYGSVIKTGALVGVVQGALILVAGIALSVLAGSLLRVPAELRGEFFWLMAGQSVLLGVTFASRIFNQLLFAHQRLDVNNYGGAVFLLLSLAAMWGGFAAKLGIYSYLIGQTLLTLGTLAVNVIGSLRLGLLPGLGEWGEISKKQFRELFAFGQGIFLISIGTQFINTSQTILLTRMLGLDAAATWTVCTRAYIMLTMVVWRIVDYSAPALSEMVVRKEHDKLLQRLRDITVLTASLSVAGGTIFAVANEPFVWVWTAGKINWPPINDVLLALWFFVCSVMRVHTGMVGVTKDLRFLRFIYLIEGSVFIGLNLLAHRIESMTLMLIFSLASTLIFSLPYGLWRTRKYFGMNWSELAGWFLPTWRLAWRLVPLAVMVWWLTRGLPDFPRLALETVVLGAWTAWMFLRFGLSKTLRTEIAGKLPMRIQRVLARFMTI